MDKSRSVFSTSSGKIFFWERTRNDDGSYGGDIILQDLGDRFVLQQYTGVKDKNGKDIYEGDIVQFKEWFPKEICFKGESSFAGFVLKNTELFLSEYDSKHMIVIGNIFENPELLK